MIMKTKSFLYYFLIIYVKMKEKIILSIAILSLLSLAVFVSASMTLLSNPDTLNTPDYKVDVKIEKGWNLLASPGELDWGLENSEIKKSDIITSYAFMPNLQEYARILPEDKMELDKLQSLDDDQSISTAMWVYSKKSGNLSYKSEVLWLNERTLFRGWNFISITPDFTDKSLDNLKGSCDIIKAYFWSAPANRWFEFSPSEIIDEEYMGYGFVLKLKNNCNMGETINPPIVPEINCEDLLPTECSDDDGGKNYNQKGIVWSTHFLDAGGEITCSDTSTGGGDECCTKCDFSENGQEGTYLREGYCDERGIAKFEKHQCPNGCQDGVCI